MKKYAGLIAVLMLVVALPVFAGQEKEVHKEHKCSEVKPLDAETKVKLKKLHLQYKLDTVDLEAKKSKIHKAVMAEFMKDDYSVKEIEKLAKDMDAVNAKMHKVKMDYMFQARKMMTPDQFKGFLHKMHGQSGCSCDCCKGGKCACGGGSCSHSKHGKAGCSAGKASCKTSAKAGCESSCKIKVKK